MKMWTIRRGDGITFHGATPDEAYHELMNATGMEVFQILFGKQSMHEKSWLHKLNLGKPTETVRIGKIKVYKVK